MRRARLTGMHGPALPPALARILGSRAAVALIALAPRLFLAWATFGTTDLTNGFRNASLMLAGYDARLPYFVGLDLLYWIGAVLAFHGDLPLTVAYKLFGVLFDVGIALALRELASSRAGLLYALAPIPVIVAAMHTQWDSVTLYFLIAALALCRLERPAGQFGAGILWVLAVASKPYVLPLLPLLLPARPWKAPRQVLALAGGVSLAILAYLTLLAIVGRPLTFERLELIATYTFSDQYFFGVPWRPLRWLAPLSLIAIVALHWRGAIAREDGVLLFFLIALAVSPLAAQYLVWPVPFLLLGRRWRAAAVYGAVAGTFLALFYSAPFLNRPNWIVVGAYGMHHGLGALAPAPLPEAWRPLLVALANYGIPLTCAALAVAVFITRRGEEDSPVRAARIVAPVGVLAGLVTVAAAWAALKPPVPPLEFIDRVQTTVVRDYDVVRHVTPEHGRAVIWVPRTVVDRPAAPVTLRGMLLVWIALAAAWCAVQKEKGPRGSPVGLS